jgi:hypothetical protein
MIAHRRFLALALSAFTLVGAGCGAGGGGDAATDDARGSNGDNTLAESDIATVLEAKRSIDAACGSGDGGASPGTDPQAIQGAVTAIVGITEQYPGRVYETGNEDRAIEMRELAETTSEQLRRCGIAAEADRLAAASEKND